MPRERSDRIARLETKLDALFVEVRQLRTDHSAEIQTLGGEIRNLAANQEAMEQRLRRAIAEELAHGLGVIEERFAHLFGLLDDKYGGAVRELRSDLDAHRLDRSMHLPRE